jgi:DNA replicative helicase MCM subunit Mcm2 (Cdc46/Mcm family)
VRDLEEENDGEGERQTRARAQREFIESDDMDDEVDDLDQAYLIFLKTVCRNYQRMALQESPGSVPPGRLPRHRW